MSGLSRTPGKRVWDNIPPRVRIPPSPPDANKKALIFQGFFVLCGFWYAIGCANRLTSSPKNEAARTRDFWQI